MKALRLLKLSFVAFVCITGSCCAQQTTTPPASIMPRINDHIFAAGPDARGSISFDARGFLIHGQRTFIVSAGIEYARVPRRLWVDRLLRLKRAGFNSVEVYTFWNFHEPREGEFDFTGDRDLGAFLDLVSRMGMYAIVRVGPYYCAEWNSGGYPIWLRFKPGLRVREVNAPFQHAVDAYFAKLLPIVAARQIQHGGAVIMVQLENEHPLAWGTGMPTPYFTHLLDVAKAYGLEVPMFFSGLHHSSDPAGDKVTLDDPTRPNPWFSTEFWCVWYDQYGPKPGDAETYGRRIWKILARGGNGYNFYMAYGGSNFAYWNSNEDAASYDYGAAVGQAGDLRPVYYVDKRAAWFARSFQQVLENSFDASPEFAAFAANPRVKTYAREGPSGTLLFLDNPSHGSVRTTLNLPSALNHKQQVQLAPGEIRPLVHNVEVAPGITIEWSIARVFGVATDGSTTTLVVYGAPGEAAPILLRSDTDIHTEREDGHISISGKLVRVDPEFSNDRPVEYLLRDGTRCLRIVSVDRALSDRTWLLGETGSQRVIVGPDYLGALSGGKGKLRLSGEQPLMDRIQHDHAYVYGEGRNPILLRATTNRAASEKVTEKLAPPRTAALAPWQTKNAAHAADHDYDDSSWTKTPRAMQMGFDENVTADAWYRASVNIPAAASYLLHIPDGGDRVQVFVDGALKAQGPIHGRDLILNLTAGAHTVAFFTASDGRDKLYAYIGPLFNKDPKGLMGPVSLRSGVTTPISGWRVLNIFDAASEIAPPPATASQWRPYAIGSDAFHNKAGFAWFQTTIPGGDQGFAHRVLRFNSVDEDATVFIDGKKAGEHKGWNIPFEVEIPATAVDANRRKPLTISVLVENHTGPGGIDQPVTFQGFKTELLFTDWRMRGGPGDPDRGTWTPLADSVPSAGPRFYRTMFTLSTRSPSSHLIWRVGVHGLGHGSVWVNSHNLGRYPEKVAVDGLYIPGCWLRDGRNALTIYDEDGRSPTSVDVHVEAAASRSLSKLVQEP